MAADGLQWRCKKDQDEKWKKRLCLRGPAAHQTDGGRCSTGTPAIRRTPARPVSLMLVAAPFQVEESQWFLMDGSWRGIAPIAAQARGQNAFRDDVRTSLLVDVLFHYGAVGGWLIWT